MASKTGKTTDRGRPVWRDEETGEDYSERSTTFKLSRDDGEEVWYTVPTVGEDGTQYSEDVIQDYVKEYGPVDWMTGEELPEFRYKEDAVEYAKSRSSTMFNKQRGYAVGGEVQLMKKMYEKGGLATDGLEIDPVSGNDIPVGSNAADVRDDVDAKLSEGEYVVPADVVKYIGVSTLEKMVNKAKEGLGDMAENGRIGGAPIASAEAKEAILEHSLGGDIEELDGYAAGGIVEGKDYNAIIDRVKAAAMKDPSITNMLKAKGIHVSGAEQGSPVKMAEGGSVPSQGSTFNPYAYTPGFSIESGVTGQAPTGGSGTTPAAAQPVTCPPGFMFDAATNSCVVDPNYQDPAQQASGGSDDNSPTPTHDPNAWMNKYDYTNPETLTAQTMSTLGMGKEGEGEKGLFGKITEGVGSLLGGGLAGGLLGKVVKSQTYAEAMANAAVLESHGKKAEAASIREAAGIFAKENGVKVGGFFDSTKTLTKSALKTYGSNTMVGSTPTSTQKPSTTTTTTSKKPSAADYKGGAGEKSTPVKTTTQLRQDKDDNSNRAEVVAKAKASAIKKAAAGSGKSIAEVGRTLAPSNKAPSKSDEAAKKAGATRGAGGQWGMAKGGLVSRPAGKAPKVQKPKTTKKGLGRK